jgi:hypothetical protein
MSINLGYASEAHHKSIPEQESLFQALNAPPSGMLAESHDDLYSYGAKIACSPWSAESFLRNAHTGVTPYLFLGYRPWSRPVFINGGICLSKVLQILKSGENALLLYTGLNTIILILILFIRARKHPGRHGSLGTFSSSHSFHPTPGLPSQRIRVYNQPKTRGGRV